MAKTSQLSQLYVTGELNAFTTPLPVWLAVASSHGIDVELDQMSDASYVQRLYRKVQESPVTLNTSLTSEDLSKIARFVNPDAKWSDSKTLLTALSHILGKRRVVDLLHKNIRIMPFDPQHSRSNTVTVCEAYRFCAELMIPLTSLTTVEEMEFGLTVWREHVSVVNTYIGLVLQTEQATRELLHKGILHTLFMLHKAFKAPKYNALNTAHQELGKYEKEPKTFAQRVCWIARQHKINILKHTDKPPLLVYAMVLENRWTKVPELSYSIDTDLPLIQTVEQLNVMACTLGLDGDEQSQKAIYTQVSNHLLTVDTFYPLNQVEFNSRTLTHTAILSNEVSSMEPGEVLVYGTFYTHKYAITFSELCDTLESAGSYRNFFDTKGGPSLFPKHVVRRLRFLSDELASKCKSRLGSILSLIDLKEAKDSKDLMGVSVAYKKASTATKDGIDTLLKDLVECGMYMRNWSGKGPYPIEKVELDPDTSAVDHRINLSILGIREKVMSSMAPPEFKLIWGLSLVRIKNGSFIPPPGADAVKTLGERLELVQKGHTVGTDSCVLMSSNYVLSTTIRLMQLLGVPISFSLERLVYVS